MPSQQQQSTEDSELTNYMHHNDMLLFNNDYSSIQWAKKESCCTAGCNLCQLWTNLKKFHC